MQILYPFCQFNFEAADQNDLFDKMNQFFLKHQLVTKTYLTALKIREKQYPTGLMFEQINLAIPHVDQEHILKEGIIFIHLKKPIVFYQMGSEEEKIPIAWVCFLLVKNKAHINVLAKLINWLQNKENQKKLTMVQSCNQLLQVLGKI